MNNWKMFIITIVLVAIVAWVIHWYEEHKPPPVKEAVDLGLSVKWASCNIGAYAPEERGEYYGVGKTREAMATWGDGWRFPTDAEWNELMERCTWQWTTRGKSNGYTITGPNGNSIFLPAAGEYWRDWKVLHRCNEYGVYWVSSPEKYRKTSFNLILHSRDEYSLWGSTHDYSIRPVCE